MKYPVIRSKKMLTVNNNSRNHPNNSEMCVFRQWFRPFFVSFHSVVITAQHWRLLLWFASHLMMSSIFFQAILSCLELLLLLFQFMSHSNLHCFPPPPRASLSCMSTGIFSASWQRFRLFSLNSTEIGEMNGNVFFVRHQEGTFHCSVRFLCNLLGDTGKKGERRKVEWKIDEILQMKDS